MFVNSLIKTNVWFILTESHGYPNCYVKIDRVPTRLAYLLFKIISITFNYYLIIKLNLKILRWKQKYCSRLRIHPVYSNNIWISTCRSRLYLREILLPRTLGNNISFKIKDKSIYDGFFIWYIHNCSIYG